MIDLQKHIWEGWTVGDFVERLAPELDRIYVGTQLASSLCHEAGTCHVVPGESALLQKAHSGSCCLFCPEVSFTFIVTGDDLLPSLLCREPVP